LFLPFPFFASIIPLFSQPSLQSYQDKIGKLFWICFKAGAFVFGTGIAITPILERDFVQSMHWITHGEFMDALAIGQITPGPVLLTTTFLGYKVAGLLGAITATTGVFLAGFIHMSTWFPMAVEKLATQKWIEDFLFGALAMVVGTILVTVIVLLSKWTSSPILYLIVVFSLLESAEFLIKK
jgi:chromate transporter